MTESVVIIGASLGGIRAAEMLRRKKYEGRITLIGDERHLPYDRPPLSKQILTGAMAEEKIALRRKPYEDLDLDLRLGIPATRFDAATRTVTLKDGSTVTGDAVIIATGARARRIPHGDFGGVHVIRTLDDSRALKADLAHKPKVCVIGAGFIGAEVASSARELGCEVTVLEALAAPIVRGLGEALGGAIAKRIRDSGATLHCGVRVKEIVGTERVKETASEGHVTHVTLEDGREIPCGVVVVGIGAIPNVEWLEGSGLDVDNGVLCDEHCRAADGVYAIGDCANFMNPLFGERMRLEHWTNAVDGAKAAVDHILNGDEAAPNAHVPSFWSDQFGVKIQGAGCPRATDEMHVCHGTLDDEKFAVLFGRDGKLSGVVTFGLPPKAIQYQRMIGKGASWEEALEKAAG